MIVSVCETKTGDHVLDIPVTSMSWPSRLNGNGRGRFTIPLREISTDPAFTSALFQKRARMIVVHDGETVGHAGVIMTDDWSERTGLLSLSTYEIRNYWLWRMTAGVNNIQYEGDLKASGLSALGAVRRVVQRSMQWDGWEMPIDPPMDGSGSIDLDVDWFEFRYLEDIIQDIERHGYEVWLEPRLTSNGVRFTTRVGRAITNGDFDLPVSTMKSAVADLAVKGDATRQVTGVLGLGNGSGTDSLIAWSGLPFAEGIPVADVVRNEPDVKRADALQAITNDEFTENRTPVEQWSFPVVLDDVLTLDKIRIGRVLHMDVRDSIRIPDGQYTRRVIAISGDRSNRVTVEVHPYGA
ncbi:hypothetical protein GCM10010915_11790 [Microbacterium faecale]|uniref:Minor tail protein n=1 Tax=Microbacterium faecale TaxID=1804630 RepID=A0A916Y6E9_9MICO|nr:hypothetical protein [Microbacterium faecale]GGD33051.1 hypothetical protein GCM10010915_11790 [Microbacterium faecale]